VSVTPQVIREMLGPRKFRDDLTSRAPEVGIVNGLAWTSAGGELLQVEALTVEGTGKIELTGSLGDVMKESARTAISYIRSISQKYGINPDFYKTKDIHIHFPEGAIPKDGPSAGITIATAIFSQLTGNPVRADVAMTGEITLHGKVLPIGGLKEKSVAAYRSHIASVLIPEDNLPDLEEVDGEVKENVIFIPVKNIAEVFGRAVVGGSIEASGDGVADLKSEPAEIYPLINEDVKPAAVTGVI